MKSTSSVYLPLSPEVPAGERRLCVRRAEVGPPPAGGRTKKACFSGQKLEIAGVVLPVRAFQRYRVWCAGAASPAAGLVLVRFAAVEARLPPALRTYLKETFSGSGILPPPELGVRLPRRYSGGALPAACLPQRCVGRTGDGSKTRHKGHVCRLCDIAPAPG